MFVKETESHETRHPTRNACCCLGLLANRGQRRQYPKGVVVPKGGFVPNTDVAVAIAEAELIANPEMPFYPT